MNVITVGEAAACVSLLEGASEVMPAASIAERLGLTGCRETQRRHVRAIIDHLRAGNCKVVADSQGYWLTDDEKVWRDYLENRQIDAKVVLGSAHRRRRESVRAGSGQRSLFGSLRRNACECRA